jgi:acetoin utilization deacetylase AcuC-like enzyme
MTPIPIFYRFEMSADNSDSFSPSASKPRLCVEHWLKSGRIKPEQIHSFEPARRADLYLAHDPAYVDAVLDLRAPNGFGNYSEAVAASLPYTTGSMVAAVNYVLEHGGHACSPTSGFHHAAYDGGGGFCTFNGLMVAAIVAVAQGAKVGILDCDAHYGDGTDNILRRVQGHGIRHHTFGRHFPCGQVAADRDWSDWLHSAVDDLAGCDVVIYQAGADPHIQDPLGGQMRTKAMLVRDCIALSLPNVAWNLAGGYRRDEDGGISCVLDLHTHTLNVSQGGCDASTPRGKLNGGA